MGDQPLNQRLRELREAVVAPATEPAPEQPPSQTRAPLGLLLVGKGLISEAVLEQALERQREQDRPLGRILLEIGAISPQTLTRALTEQHGVDASGSLRARLTTIEGAEGEGDDGSELYLVREASDGDTLLTASTFLDAADAALELIDERDPDRLEIVRADGGELEHVWSYRRADGPSPPPYPS